MALAGVVGAAVMAYALNREGLRRDRANADRYEKAAVALDQLAARVDPIAAEIADGRTEALPAFVDAVAGQLEASTSSGSTARLRPKRRWPHSTHG